MNKYINFFNFGFLDRIDRYLLLNHTLIWNFKLPYMAFYSLLLTIPLFFLTPSQISNILQYLQIIIVFYVYWLYIQKKYIFLQEYSVNKRNMGKEFVMIFISTVLFFFPIIMSIIIFFGSLSGYKDDLGVANSQIVDRVMEYRNTYQRTKSCLNLDEKNMSFYLNSLPENISGNRKATKEVLQFHIGLCPKVIEKQKYINKIVKQIYSTNEITEDMIYRAMFSITFVDDRILPLLLFLLFVPFQIVFFKYIGRKKYFSTLFFLVIYTIVWLTYKELLEPFIHKIPFRSIIIYFLGVILLFLVFKKYRLFFIYNISFALIFFFLANIHFIIMKPFYMILIFYITVFFEFLIFIFIDKYLVELLSQPKE